MFFFFFTYSSRKKRSKYKALLTELLWEAEKQAIACASPVHDCGTVEAHLTSVCKQYRCMQKLPEPALHSGCLFFIFHDNLLKEFLVLLKGRLFCFGFGFGFWDKVLHGSPG